MKKRDFLKAAGAASLMSLVPDAVRTRRLGGRARTRRRRRK